MATKSTTKQTAPEPTETEDRQVTLAGRLCTDPVLRHTRSGRAVTTVRIAVNPPEGEATFHTVVVWNRTAEVLCEYKRKGHPVKVTGRSRERTYTPEGGEPRTVNEVSAHRVRFLSRTELAAAAAAPEQEVA